MVRRTRGTGETAESVAAEAAGDKVAPADITGGGNRAVYASDTLLSFCERYERMTEEIDVLTEDRKEIMAEAKSTGFDTKILKEAIRRRAMEAADRAEHDSLLHTYEEGLEEATRRARAKSIEEGGDPAE